MILSEQISVQEGVPTSQSDSPITNTPELAKQTPCQNHFQARVALSGDPTAVTSATNNSLNDLKSIYLGSRGGSYITKLLPDHKYGLTWPKNQPAKTTPKIACSTLSGDPTAVTSVTKHSIFIKWP